jgi:hypothetical protein
MSAGGCVWSQFNRLIVTGWVFWTGLPERTNKAMMVGMAYLRSFDLIAPVLV